jgi:TolB-like protein
VQKPFIAYQGSKSFVFVCYSHADQDAIFPEIAWLNEQGINLWYDEGISPGVEWSQALADAIERCERVLFYVSPSSVSSEHCRREISFAQSKGHPVLVVHLEDTDLPGSLELSLSNRQALFRHHQDETSYRAKLLGALKGEEFIDRPRVTTKPKSKQIVVVCITLALLAIGGFLWIHFTRPDYSPTSIVVLPFEDLSPKMDQRWLADGMAETLTFFLSRVEALEVTQAPRSALQTGDWQEMAAKFHAGSIVTGSIRLVDERLNVTARLMDQDGTLLWSATYNRDLGEVFVQREIAKQIIGAIEDQFDVQLPAQSTFVFNEARYGAADIRAYKFWRDAINLKFGGTQLDEDGMRKVLRLNLKSVEIDPEFSQGFVGLGATYLSLFRFTRDPRDRQAAKAALDRALVLDNQNGVAIGNRAVLAAVDKQWLRVIELVDSAENIADVTDVGKSFISYVVALVNLGRWAEANAAVEELGSLLLRTPERYPPEAFIHAEYAHGLMMLKRDFTGVIESLTNSLSLSPPPGWLRTARSILVTSYRQTGREADAKAMFLSGLSNQEQLLANLHYGRDGWAGMLHALVEYRQQSGLDCHPGTVNMYAELGMREQMYTCLDTPRPGAVSDLLWTLPVFDVYRNEPEFEQLLDTRKVVGYRSCCPF